MGNFTVMLKYCYISIYEILTYLWMFVDVIGQVTVILPHRFSNCSAYFTGGQALAIRELAQIVYGESLGANQVSPALTISAAVYPIDFGGNAYFSLQNPYILNMEFISIYCRRSILL